LQNHVRSDTTLLFLERWCGKAALIELARQAAYLPKITELIRKWDELSASAKKAASLSDLLNLVGLSPAHFIAKVLRIDMDAGHIRVLTALQKIKELPVNVEHAINEEFTVAKRWGQVSDENPTDVG
jgi:hypothetical protein